MLRWADLRGTAEDWLVTKETATGYTGEPRGAVAAPSATLAPRVAEQRLKILDRGALVARSSSVRGKPVRARHIRGRPLVRGTSLSLLTGVQRSI